MKKIINEEIQHCNECPYCDLRIAGYLCKESFDRIICHDPDKINIQIPEWCSLDDYEGPGVKVGLTLMVIRDGKILLGQRKNTETADGEWANPGGRMDYGEEPVKGAIRELEEETGLIIKGENISFLCYMNEFFPENKKHYLTHYFVTENAQGEVELKEPDKCEKWKWFDFDNLPENTFWTIKEAIKKFQTSKK